jgi:3-methyladenine DNA glycosylase AlkD
MNKILLDLKKELKSNADEHTKKTAQRFFKEKIKAYGIKTALVEKISKKYFKLIEELDKEEIFDLCEKLFASGYIEESFVACNWSYKMADIFEEKDWQILEHWLKKYVNNWATCDTFCNHTMGAFVERYPKYLAKLQKWAKSKNRWVKRAAAVTLIIPAKKGKFLKEVFVIADILLLDNDDLVQKGYGWMLKVASKEHQKEVFKYVMQRKAQMPRTALRYAIEKMPKELKVQAMKK